MADGRLLLIGTPIGNLNDLTPRALEALKRCDLLLCEDTRHTGLLLQHFGVSAKLESFHDHNEDSRTAAVLQRLAAGETIGLVSDAGMPLLSDPGYVLVRAARTTGVVVEPIPGPFAGALALIASGLPPQPFVFHGFAPHRQGDRQRFYSAIAAQRMTAVVYESPERILRSLEDARAALGDVEVTVAREMTKLHEEFLHGTISSVLETLEARPAIRGEITIVFASASETRTALDPAACAAEFRRLRAEGMSRPDATRLLSEKYGIARKELYRMLVDGPADEETT
jgi:16S rRNA (cytidine1402-2'-O)-methyltransferase